MLEGFAYLTGGRGSGDVETIFGAYVLVRMDLLSNFSLNILAQKWSNLEWY